MPRARRVAANRRVLAALLARPGIDVSRVVHHAAQAGDTARSSTMDRSRPARRRRPGAHREAALTCGWCSTSTGARARGEADLWESLAIEGYTIDAPTARRWRPSGARSSCGREDDPAPAARRCAGCPDLWWAGDPDGADAAADEAIAVLDGAGDDQLLAMALSAARRSCTRSRARRRGHRHGGAGHRARPGLPAILSHALNNLGVALNRIGDRGRSPSWRRACGSRSAGDEPEQPAGRTST
jgi:hypothetical protein